MRCIVVTGPVITKTGNILHRYKRRVGQESHLSMARGAGRFDQSSNLHCMTSWCRSIGARGFANTDLDLQLKKYGIHKLIIIGLIAHTCVEATVRFAAELGYEVTVVKDATADYSDKEMDAALE
jgi:isochorismatase family protein